MRIVRDNGLGKRPTKAEIETHRTSYGENDVRHLAKSYKVQVAITVKAVMSLLIIADNYSVTYQSPPASLIVPECL